MKAKCSSCERLETVNEALRDRCGTLELINEGLNERAVAQLNVEPQTDLNGRVAVLQLDRAMRRIRELEAENSELYARLNPPPACPVCESVEISGDVRIGPVEPDTGHVDSEEIYRCGECGSTGPAQEVQNAA